MMTPRHRQRGVVLATTLYYLAVLSVLVVGTLYAARGAHAGVSLVATDAVLGAAIDDALTSVLTAWNSVERSRQSVGIRAALTVPAHNDGVRVTASVTRLGPALFWLSGEAQLVADATARRRVTRLVRLNVPQPMVASPIVVQGDVTVGDNAQLLVDQASADCPGDITPALTLAPDATLTFERAHATDSTFIVAYSPAAASPLLLDAFGSESWSTLAARADVRLSAGATVRPALIDHATCPTTRALDDWSDRTAADGCVIAPPIIVAAGDLTIEGGAGTGLILVVGRLRIAGPFVFRGVVVARGGVEITGDDVDITGSVLAARLTTTASGSALVVRGRTLIHASRCSAYRVFASYAGVRSVRTHAWLERF
jgi:hypothetical protein